jgi:hypothetical protein
MKKFLLVILICISVLIIILPQSPKFVTHLGIDEGVYQYEGNTILSGNTPYKDAWDHKQPLTYFIYALGSLLVPQSFWGVWLIEFIFLGIAAILAFILLNKFCSPFGSLGIVLAALFSISLLNGYGTPELLAISFSLVALLVFYHLLTNENRFKRREYFLSLVLGIITASIFFLKQILIAVPLVISIYYVFHIVTQRKWKSFINVGFFLVGFSGISLLILIFLWSRQALSDYWNAAYVFNFMYSRSGLVEKLNSILNQLEFIYNIPVFWLTFGLWVGGLICGLFLQIPLLSRLWKKRGFSFVTLVGGLLIIGLILIRSIIIGNFHLGVLDIAGLVLGTLFIVAGLCKIIFPTLLHSLEKIANFQFIREIQSQPTEFQGMLSIAILLFPFVLFFNSFSGQNYYYYYFCLFPEIILLLGLCVRLSSTFILSKRARGITTCLVIGLFLATCYTPLLQIITQYKKTPDPQYLEAIDYIKKSSLPTDRIYVWGKDIGIYGAVNRTSPSKYFYQLGAVDWKDYAIRYGVIQEILGDFQKTKPFLFVLTDNINLGQNQNECLKAAENRDIDKPIFIFLCENYLPDQQYGNLQIFRLKKP